MLPAIFSQAVLMVGHLDTLRKRASQTVEGASFGRLVQYLEAEHLIFEMAHWFLSSSHSRHFLFLFLFGCFFSQGNLRIVLHQLYLCPVAKWKRLPPIICVQFNYVHHVRARACIFFVCTCSRNLIAASSVFKWRLLREETGDYYESRWFQSFAAYLMDRQRPLSSTGQGGRWPSSVMAVITVDGRHPTVLRRPPLPILRY